MPSPHWIVSAYHRVRALSFAYTLLFMGVYADRLQAPVLLWVLLGLQFLVYPHLVYYWARASADTLRAEQRNLQIDMALWGLWSAVLGFPPWITFTLFITSGVNHIISFGPKGLAPAVGLYLVGVLLGALLAAQGWGWPVAAVAEGPWVTALCALGTVGYLLVVGLVAYRRNQTLRRLRGELQDSEQSLQQANDKLRERLMQIERLQLQLQDQAHRDPLTGLYNRRYLQETLEREQARCAREGQPLALMMLDIDHFKSINDRFGHQWGDAVLRGMGTLLQAHSRREDIPCRIGGEEFVLVLPCMPAAQAQERAEQIRAAFAAQTVLLEPGDAALQATVSIGIAVYPEHGQGMDALCRSADAALYAVKHAGRNGVRLAGSPAAVAQAV